jgi:hypothetical protein
MASTVANIVANSADPSLSFIFKPIAVVFSTIVKVVKEIQEVIRRAKVNKHQCSRLSERIIIIVSFLQSKQINDTLSKPMKVALVAFAQFLQKCLEFVNTYTNASSWKCFWNNKDYSRQFAELHTELTQHTTDLCCGIQLADNLVNNDQNECATCNASPIALALPFTVINQIFFLEIKFYFYRQSIVEQPTVKSDNKIFLSQVFGIIDVI